MTRPGFRFALLLATAVFEAPALADTWVDEPPVHIESPSLVADLTFGFLTGDYGSGTDSTVQSTSARLRWLMSRGEFRATLPYYRLSNRGNVTLVGGRPIVPRLAPGIGLPIPAGPVVEEATTGLGDAKARGELFLLQGTETRPWLTALAEVKFPTAAEDTGLGTGQADYTGGLGFVQPLGRSSLLLDASYTRMGDPPNFDFDNILSLGGGLSVPLGSRPGRYGFLYYESRTNPVQGLEDRRDLLAGAAAKLGQRQRIHLSGSLLVGMSDTAEDLGVTFTLGGSF